VRSSWPWLTTAVVAAAWLSGIWPGAAALEYRRGSVAGGEVWRLVTGQAVHWSPRMAAVDLGMVLLLGALIEARSRRLVAGTFIAGTIACGLGIRYLQPTLARYRGASGVASALLAALAVTLVLGGLSGWPRAAAALALALLLGKITAELVTGHAFFAGPLPAGIEVTPLVHLVGTLAGTAAALAIRVRPVRRG